MNQKEKELFMCLVSFKEPNRKKIERLIECGAASPELLGHVLANRMGGVAYGVLESCELLSKTDREFRNALGCAKRYNEKLNEDYMGCLNYLSVQLESCGVPYAMLKGAYLCGKYPSGYRTSNDIDILVSSDNVGKISAKLKSAGFKQGYLKNGVFVEATRQQIIESKMTRGETVPFIKEIKLPFIKYLEVDINFSLDYKNSDDNTVKEMLERTNVINIKNTKIRTLSETDFFLHLCSHLYKEATTVPWIRMKRDMTFYKFCDIYMLVREMNEETSHSLIKEAEKRGLEYEFVYCLTAIDSFYGLKNKVFGDFVTAYDSDDIYNVIAPTEKKLYRYKERDIVKRFFARDRINLLEEVIK